LDETKEVRKEMGLMEKEYLLLLLNLREILPDSQRARPGKENQPDILSFSDSISQQE